MVGCQGRLDASTRKRGRSGQRCVLVSPGWQARLPGATGCGMAQHRERFAGIDRPLAFCDCESGSDCEEFGFPLASASTVQVRPLPLQLLRNFSEAVDSASVSGSFGVEAFTDISKCPRQAVHHSVDRKAVIRHAGQRYSRAHKSLLSKSALLKLNWVPTSSKS